MVATDEVWSARTPAAQAAASTLRVPSTLIRYSWSSSRGPDLKINGGTLTQADVQLRDLPLLSLVIPPLRQIWSSKS